jgi:GH15 family glucan-1,4-alpha-glucosidase
MPEGLRVARLHGGRAQYIFGPMQNGSLDNSKSVSALYFGLPRAAFNVCASWRADALSRMGCTARARETFKVMLACRTPPGLPFEDVASSTGDLLGNEPQTHAMVGEVKGAMRLSLP